MYIAPNTNIRILKNVPLDTSYDHTIWFDSASDQSTYFIGKQKYNLSNYTYQRVNSGIMKVGIEADNLYDCNYLMFQNTAFGNKWFYAFITEVNYVNNDVSEIKYEMDDIQSWFFDFDFQSTYVLREHSTTDIIGENILPEPVTFGEYWHDPDSFKKFDGFEFSYIVATVDLHTTTTHTASIQGKIYDNLFGACTLKAFRSLGISGYAVDNLINTYLQSFISHPEEIISIYTCPSLLVPWVNDTDQEMVINSNSDSFSKLILDIPQLTGEETFKTYEPKNNKLYTYPYNFYQVYTNTNNSLNLRYEFFFGFKPKFLLQGCMTEPVKLILRPYNYQGFPNDTEAGGENPMTLLNLTLEDYPKCSFAIDSYQQWVAQRSMPILLDFLTGGVSGSLMSASALTEFGGNLFSEQYTASIKADQCRGSYACGSVDVQNNKQAFYGIRTHLNFNDAKCIDDFFSRYGYACKEIKTPNRNSRPHWNYVKTMNCTIEGSIPADSEKHICQIHDKGITYWKNGDEVGHYELNNSPATPTPTP